MYASLPKGKTSILLWCYGRSHRNCDTPEELGKSQKHKSSVDTNPPPPSKRKQLESDVDEISSEFKRPTWSQIYFTTTTTLGKDDSFR